MRSLFFVELKVTAYDAKSKVTAYNAMRAEMYMMEGRSFLPITQRVKQGRSLKKDSINDSNVPNGLCNVTEGVPSLPPVDSQDTLLLERSLPKLPPFYSTYNLYYTYGGTSNNKTDHFWLRVRRFLHPFLPNKSPLLHQYTGASGKLPSCKRLTLRPTTTPFIPNFGTSHPIYFRSTA